MPSSSPGTDGPLAQTARADCGRSTVNPAATKRRRLSRKCSGEVDSNGKHVVAGASKARVIAASPQSVRTARSASISGWVGQGSSRFVDLAAGPYFVIASGLDPAELCRLDAACRSLLALNGRHSGPWHNTGSRLFSGMEIRFTGGFSTFEQGSLPVAMIPTAGIGSWKSRCALYQRELPKFSPPFTGGQIVNVEQPDEVAYCCCRVRMDLLARQPDDGIYLEVAVVANADNLSIAVVDFEVEGGGHSSVTFSPEGGAVLRERKVREMPRAIEGTYIHLLETAPPGRRFEGAIGVYICGSGHLAFFRRWNPEEGSATGELPDWETTGFCTDLTWAQGPRLSLCLAFRDNGYYNVQIKRVCRRPPIQPHMSRDAYQEGRWNTLYGDEDHPLAI